MAAPRNHKFVDGKDQSMWPVHEHIGWTVQTAGVVELDIIHPKSSEYNQGPSRILGPRTKVLLKHIDEKGRAYVYNFENGVMMMPQELLEPVGK